MTRVTPVLTGKKIFNFTYSKQETLLGTPETLPTSEPATPQIGYTIQNSDFPVISPNVYSKKHIALVYAGGKAVTAATISWRMKKNGASVATGSLNVSANNFYTLTAFFGVDVAAGDVLEIALWSNQTDSNWDYKALQVQATRILFLNKPRLLTNATINIASQPSLTLGTPNSYAKAAKVAYSDIIYADFIINISVDALHGGNTYGNLRLGYADYEYVNTAAGIAHPSYRPYYYANYAPTQVSFRGVLIG
ncbi:MAG: hypothetical protein QXJ31_01970 [Candidatus Bathyarchaeia archaeon]